MRRLLSCAWLALALACSTERLKPSAIDCPNGCWTDEEACVPGDAFDACGDRGQWCTACATNAACYQGACVSSDFEPSSPTDGGTLPEIDPLGALTIAPDFEVLGWQPLDARILKVAALQSDQPNAQPKLYALVPAFNEIRSLGTFETYAVGAKLSDASAPGDGAKADFSNSHFLANRETVMVSYLHNGVSPRAWVFSETRLWGDKSYSLFGNFHVAPVGDFFSFSANGFDSQSGAGLYVMLGGPAVSNVHRVATHQGAKPGHVSWAIRDLNIVGVHTATTQKLYACTWDKLSGAFMQFKSFAIETGCLPIHEEAGITGLAPMASGLLVHAPTADAESVQYVGLKAEGPYDALQVSSTPAEAFLSGPLPGTRVEFLTPYGSDILVSVVDADGRRLVRVRRK